MVTLDDPRVRAQYEDEPKEELSRMSFGDHLDELRKRLWRSLIAVIVACLIFTPMHDQVISIVIEPYRILWRHNFESYVTDLEARNQEGLVVEDKEKEWLQFVEREKGRILDGSYPMRFASYISTDSGFRVPYALVATNGLEDFWTFMMASLVFALAVAAPVVIWQIWAFVSAGLYKRERRAFRMYFPFMMTLLGSGVLFGYFYVVPFGLGFLIKMMQSGQVDPLLSLSQYFSLLFWMTLALGIIFQLPVVMVALQKVGILRHTTMRKHWRWVILVICIISAVLTPTPDPFTMFMVASPAMLLYVIGLGLTYRMDRKAHPPGEAAAGSGA